MVVTSFLDSAVGIASALHLAAALPPGPAAGLATGDLLAEDLADLCIGDGWIPLPRGAGLGVAPDASRLARCATGPVWEPGG